MAAHSHEPHRKEMPGAAPVAQNRNRLVLVADDQIQRAVVVEISHGRAPSDVELAKVRPSLGRDLVEPPSAPLPQHVPEELSGLPVATQPALHEHVAVSDENVEPAVAVEIGQSRPESHVTP